MKQFLSLLLIEVSAMSGAAFFVGIVAGIAGLLLGKTVAGAAYYAGAVYFALVAVLPAALWLPHYAMNPQEHAGVYAHLPSTLAVVMVGAVIGGALGAGPLFLVTGVNLPIVLGGLDATAFNEAMRERIFWGGFSLVEAATIVIGLIIAIWVYFTRAREVSNGGAVNLK